MQHCIITRIQFFLVKLGNFNEGVDAFNDALALATSLSDLAAEAAITKALDDLKNKLHEGTVVVTIIYLG